MDYGLPSSHALNTVCLTGYFLHYVTSGGPIDAKTTTAMCATVFLLVMLVGIGNQGLRFNSPLLYLICTDMYPVALSFCAIEKQQSLYCCAALRRHYYCQGPTRQRRFALFLQTEGLIEKVDLTEEEAEASVDLLLEEQNEALISAFLVLLRAKGETFQEIVGLAWAMFKRCQQVEGLQDVVDIVGTGGDGADTVNISTGASVIAAAVGARVAKQGNRSSSSACGSADVLEALGVNIHLGPDEIKTCVEEASIGFMMSPNYHPAMKIVSPVRKKLKVKTVFNISGPMLNPARVPFAVVGVYNEDIGLIGKELF